MTTLVAVSVALPFGLLAAIYLSELAPARARRILKPALEVLAGVPTIGEDVRHLSYDDVE